MNASALTIEKQFIFMKLQGSSLQSHYLYDDPMTIHTALKCCTEMVSLPFVFALLLLDRMLFIVKANLRAEEGGTFKYLCAHP